MRRYGGICYEKGLINAVLVGCDRVAANGDTANKIGTSSLAVLANYYGIPFYVLGPYSTIDFRMASGDGINIEQRESDEIKEMFLKSRRHSKKQNVLTPLLTLQMQSS